MGHAARQESLTLQECRGWRWSTGASCHHVGVGWGLPALASMVYCLAEQPRDEP